jgi:SAM-dependent methyltransferase
LGVITKRSTAARTRQATALRRLLIHRTVRCKPIRARAERFACARGGGPASGQAGGVTPTGHTMDALAEHPHRREPLYADAEFYDRLVSELNSDAEVGFYASIAGPSSASVLELGCGSGRLILPLARAGHDVTGIDNSPAMLAVARRKALVASVAPTLLLSDVRRFSAGSRFRLIFFAHNSIGHLHTFADLQACLHCVHAHLADDGLFVIDMFNPLPRLLAAAPDAHGRIGSCIDNSGQRVDVTETSHYDDATQMLHRVWHRTSPGGHETTVGFKTRVLFPQELETLLRLSGFSIRARYGSFAREPFTKGSPQQLVVCAEAAARHRSFNQMTA